MYAYAMAIHGRTRMRRKPPKENFGWRTIKSMKYSHDYMNINTYEKKFSGLIVNLSASGSLVVVHLRLEIPNASMVSYIITFIEKPSSISLLDKCY